MGLRFRKSVKIAPGVKLNLNKKSTSMTFGRKGIHHTISSTGKKTSTVGIPGTGISYSKISGSTNKKSSLTANDDYYFDDLDDDLDNDIDDDYNLDDISDPVNVNNNKKPRKKEQISPFKVAGCLTQIVILVLLVCVFSWIVSFFNSLKSSLESPSEEDIPVISEAIEPEAPTPETSPMYANAEVNVRSGAGTATEIIGTLSPSEEVAVISNENGWAKILYNDAEAYVSSNYLAENKPNVTRSTTSVDQSTQDTNVPTEHRSALKKARLYSDAMSMSKQGIYEQLISEHGENFSEEAVQYAMDNLQADWNANALKKAKDYSDTMYMSKQGIYEQLISEHGEKFTAEEAQYAVDNVSADWNANALAKAKDYQDSMNMSPEAIRDQLASEYGEKFTVEEANYAISNLN